MKPYYKLIIVLLCLFSMFLCCQQRSGLHQEAEKLTGTIVFGRLGGIYTFDTDSKKITNIFTTYKSGRYAMYPVWLDQHSILFTLQDAAFSNKYLALMDSAGNNFNVVLKLNENCIMPSVSPNKRSIAFLCGKWEEQLERINYKLCTAKADGSGLKTYPLPLQAYKPAWSPKGEHVAVTDISNAINIVNVKTGVSEKISIGVSPSFSPDGLRIAFIKPKGNAPKGDINLMVLSSKKETTLLKNEFFSGAPEWSPQWTDDGKFLLIARFATVLLPQEKQTIEAYSIEQNRLISLLEVKSKILGFSHTR